LIALLRLDTTELIFDIDAILATQVEQILALHV